MPQNYPDLTNAERLTRVNGPGTDTYGDASGLSGNASSLLGDLTGLTGNLSVLMDRFTIETGCHGDVAVLSALCESETLMEWTIGTGDIKRQIVLNLALVLLDEDEVGYDPDLYIGLIDKFDLRDVEDMVRAECTISVTWPT